MVDARDAVEAHAGPVPYGRIFISYRREETAYPASWLFDRLTEHFGEGSVFKDVDSIKFGDDFGPLPRADVIPTPTSARSPRSSPRQSSSTAPTWRD